MEFHQKETDTLTDLRLISGIKLELDHLLSTGSDSSASELYRALEENKF